MFKLIKDALTRDPYKKSNGNFIVNPNHDYEFKLGRAQVNMYAIGCTSICLALVTLLAAYGS